VKQLLLVLLAGFLCAGCAAPHKFPFREVSPGVYEGFAPKSKKDYEVLREHGIRTILSLRALRWHIPHDRWKAHRNGFDFVNRPIPATPFEPSEESVKVALIALHDPALHPVYIHCLLGRDRTTMVVALYRIYFEDWTPEAAWKEMLHCGFKQHWTLRGFETYFWSHTQKPDWVYQVRADEQTKTNRVEAMATQGPLDKTAENSRPVDLKR